MDGISITDSEFHTSYPSYCTLTLCEKEKILAVLQRRLFANIPGVEAVDYEHRANSREFIRDNAICEQAECNGPSENATDASQFWKLKKLIKITFTMSRCFIGIDLNMDYAL